MRRLLVAFLGVASTRSTRVTLNAILELDDANPGAVPAGLPPGALPPGLPPGAEDADEGTDYAAAVGNLTNQLQSLQYGRETLIPALEEASDLVPIDFTIQTNWGARNSQTWMANILEDIDEGGRLIGSVNVPVGRLDWGTGGAVAYDQSGQPIFKVHQLNKEPVGNKPWTPPKGCKKTRFSPNRGHVFCILPPTGTDSDECLFTIVRMLQSLFVYKPTETGQELMFQSTIAPSSASFHTNSCPGKQSETNPLGFEPYTNFGHARFYRKKSSVWHNDEGADIGLLLTVSSILIQQRMVQPDEAASHEEHPRTIKQNKDRAEAPSYPADDLPVMEFASRLVQPPYDLGGAPPHALLPKMVSADYQTYTVTNMESEGLPVHGLIRWDIDAGEMINESSWQSKPVHIASLNWVRGKTKVMEVQAQGHQMFWIRQSREPKGSPKWRPPEGCTKKYRPVAHSNRFFCVTPPGANDATPCLFTFQRNKYSKGFFVYQGADMLYQMYCTANDYSHCSVSKQNCQGNAYESYAKIAILEMAYTNQIKLQVSPNQDTALLLAIASMILHKER